MNKKIVIIVLLYVLFRMAISWRNNIEMWRERFKYVHEDLRGLLKVMTMEFENMGIEDWWISDGTLLGYYRDKKIIPWDDDMDIFIVIKEGTKEKLEELDRRLKEKHGMQLKSNQFGTAISYLDGNRKGYIDFFFCKEEQENGKIIYKPNEWTLNHWENDYFYKEYTYPLQKVEFEGSIVNIPKEGMEFIKRMYGEKSLTEYKMFSTHHVNSIEKMIIKLLKPIPIKK